MKFSRVFWVILVAGIIIAGGVFLFTLYQDGIDEQNLTEEQLALVQTELPDLNSQVTNLEEELARLEAELALALEELEDVEGEFIDSVSSIEYSDLLFHIADIVEVEIMEMTCSETYIVTLNNIKYEATDFSLTVEGYEYNILQYLSVIEVGVEFNTTIIEYVDMSFIAEGTVESDEESQSQAVIDIKILSYKGG